MKIILSSKQRVKLSTTSSTRDFPSICRLAVSFDLSHAKALIDFITGYELEEQTAIYFKLSF